jgi:hypothetical protein
VCGVRLPCLDRNLCSLGRGIMASSLCLEQLSACDAVVGRREAKMKELPGTKTKDGMAPCSRNGVSVSHWLGKMPRLPYRDGESARLPCQKTVSTRRAPS